MGEIVDDGSGISRQVSLSQEDIDSLNRLITLARPREKHALEDVQAIRRVGELITTAEEARKLSYAAIERIILERQAAGDPAFCSPAREEEEEEDYVYILPQDRSVCAGDCRDLLEAIQREELDEFDLKNEINAQWTRGYNQSAKEGRSVDT